MGKSPIPPIFRTTAEIPKAIEAYCISQGIAESTFGKRAVNDSKLVARLRAGGSLQLGTLASIEAALAAADEKGGGVTIQATSKTRAHSFGTPHSQGQGDRIGLANRMSSRKFSRQFSRSEVLNYRAACNARWQKFIRAHFQCPEHAAFTFGVDATTAKNWWEGSNAPSGFAVDLAYERFSVEAAQNLGGANEDAP